VTRTDSASRVLRTPPDEVFAALVDVEARTRWLPPTGMTGRFEWFDPRPGGGYRLALSYDDPTIAGKTEGNTDVTEVRFTVVDPPHRVVEEADFVSDDPDLGGTMTIEWRVEPDPDGSRVTVTAYDVPAGISQADHDTALASTLANLADLVSPAQ
jgi:uncharacterized protein YndB with AHSA1/START domain